MDLNYLSLCRRLSYMEKLAAYDFVFQTNSSLVTVVCFPYFCSDYSYSVHNDGHGN